MFTFGMTPNERLRAWRTGEGLTLAAAGEKIGVSAPTFLDYEKSRKRPSRGPRRELIEAVAGIPADAWATAKERALDARARAAQADADRPSPTPPTKPRAPKRTPRVRTKLAPVDVAPPAKKSASKPRRKVTPKRKAKGPGPLSATQPQPESPSQAERLAS